MVGTELRALVVTDVNMDGKLDVAVSHRENSGKVTVLLGAGDGSFQSKETYVVGRPAKAIVAFDFNGDGFPDLATSTEEGTAILFNAADWPPLPIGDGPRPSAPLKVGETADTLHPTASQTQTSRRLTINPVDESATKAPAPKYTSRHIGRVALAETTDSEIDLFSTKLS